MGRLMGRIAVITGASRGIGRAIAVRLAQEGAYVVINFHSNAEAAQTTLNEVRGIGADGELLPFDVAEAGACERALGDLQTRRGVVDILINNAGLVHNGLIVRLKDDEVRRLLAVNLGGAIHCTRAVAAGMMKRRSGRIINISSVVGLTGNAGQSIYAATKAALVGFTKSVARELAPRNITVNAVAPGFVQTDMTAALPEATRNDILGNIPLARAGTPAEVAEAVCFLALPEAGYITGHVLDVNGGMYM